MSNETILDLHGLSKHYGKAVALDRIDLHVRPGEFLTFLGPSGSGKTTTLNLIAGFIDETEGTMKLSGKPLEKLKAHERNLGVVFQHYALFPHMSVRENVEYPLKQRKINKSERTRMVTEALDMVRLGQYADRQPKQLSGGQQQRVALARALVYNPPILLMDEPLGALDKKLREWLQLELRRIHRELGSTFIYVTHDQEEALVLSDRIAVFNEGRIEQIGTSHELYNEPQTLFVGRFIGESSVFKGTVSGGKFQAGGAAFAAEGDCPDGPAAILVRPERLEVSDEAGSTFGPEVANRLSGTVEDVVFLGSDVKYNITTEFGDAVARVPVEAENNVQIGTRVSVGWRTENALMLPDTDVAA
jgi:putative spermidine/putrescine transport system ATP-binding protein